MRELPRPAQFYITLISALACVALLASLPAAFVSTETFLVAVALSALIALFDLYPVGFHETNVETTVSTAVKISGILLFDPRLVVIGAFVGTSAAEWRIKRTGVKKLFNVAVMTLTYAVLAAIYTSLDDGTHGAIITLRNVLVLGLLAVVDLSFNSAAVSMVIALATRSSAVRAWLEGWKPLFWHEMTMVPLGAFIAILWNVSPWAILFAAIPMVLVRESYQLVGELRRQTINALMVLAQMLDERDEHTHRHCEFVAAHAREIALALGLPQSEAELVHRAAYLHDIGKIGMTNSILFKTGGLTPEEREQAKRHAIYGGDLLQQFPMFEKGSRYVRHHHERWDGAGYPDGLKGEQIPLGARVLCVADSFQAMIEDRPYRKGTDVESALRELVANAGTQFDPKVVNALLRAKGYASLADTRATTTALRTAEIA